jgi:DNA-binding CsgD family transcriptional regulator
VLRSAANGDEDGHLIATVSGRKKRLNRHRIIERPRLIAMLECSTPRAHVLVAPAGYGKSTLADQWIASGGRSGAWFRARRSSTDVAGLALDVARAASTLVPGCDERLREHLRAVPAPGDHPETLAEILSEDIASWPADAWLVIDEYEHIAGAEAAERFVETLIDGSTARFVVATRQPPAWATQRRILSGEILEITQTDLAMAQSEAAEVLAERSAQAPELVALAHGWPAVIGLASVSAVEVGASKHAPNADQLPETWYRFFAEEIFGALEPAVQDSLLTLAIAPVIDRQLAAQLLGDDLARTTCDTAAGVGIAVERGAQLELHPLARSFLEGHAARLAKPARAVAEACVAHYTGRRDWDSTLELINRYELREQLVPSLAEGLDDLLETARLSSADEWCAAADRLDVESPWVALARAETALRQARFIEAQTLAEVAASTESELSYRALSVAGRSAHMASREEEAIALYRRAAAVAKDERERREAMRCEAACLIDLESMSVETLTSLKAGVRSSPDDFVRVAGLQTAFEVKFGPLVLDEADRAYELVNRVRDPMLKTSFLSIYGGALVTTARYPNALSVAESLIEAAQALRFDFALPYGNCYAAMAKAGLRQWTQAHEHLEDALTRARGRDNHGEQVAVASSIRALIQQGKYEEALALDVPEHADALPAGMAELLASRALALAAASHLRDAGALLDRLRGLSVAIEPMVLARAATATIAIKAGDPEAITHVRRLTDAAAMSGAVDPLVTAYRATPALLRLLLRTGAGTDDFAKLVMRVGDGDLAEAVGQPVAIGDRRGQLSKREREVLALIEDGLTNRQIAKTLFISESTAKIHAHRIYEKLGVNSRRDLAVQALLRRKDQATSAMVATDDEERSAPL